MWIEVIACVVLIEAITNLLSKSEFFLPVRKFLFSSNYRILKFFHNLIDCPYCTSVWVSWFCTAMLYLYFNNLLPFILTLFFMGIILHRLTNVLHFLIDRIDSNHIDLDKENDN